MSLTIPYLVPKNCNLCVRIVNVGVGGGRKQFLLPFLGQKFEISGINYYVRIVEDAEGAIELHKKGFGTTQFFFSFFSFYLITINNH